MASEPGTFTYDLKIEGWKAEHGVLELLVCHARVAGESAGEACIRRPENLSENLSSLWLKKVVPMAIRASKGDEVFFRLVCAKPPRLAGDGDAPGRVGQVSLRHSKWEDLQVQSVMEIEEVEFLVPERKKP